MFDDFHALSSVELAYIPIVPQCKVCRMFVVCSRGDEMKLACQFLMQAVIAAPESSLKDEM